MRKLFQFAFSNSMFVDTLGLILAGVIVHFIYAIWVEPLAAQLVFEAAEEGSPPPRAFAVVIRNLEQEICIILGLWCLWLWLFRYQLFMDEPHLLKEDFLGLAEKESFDQAVLDELIEAVNEKVVVFPHLKLLESVQTVLTTLDPKQPASQFKEASDVGATACELYLEQLDAKLSLNKYILWAIPSVGFVGTVRGIGDALGLADEALAGDITGVANSLGVAFNSTFCALLISLLLMLISHLLQGREERLVADYKRFISADLIGRLSTLARYG